MTKPFTATASSLRLRLYSNAVRVGSADDGQIMDNPVVQKAKASDAIEISQLILGVAHYFTLDPNGAGAERFFASMSSKAIETYITNPDFDYYTCRINGELAGVVCARDGTHLFHLFVAPKYQRLGIAKHLWSHIKESRFNRSGVNEITVNSTPYAVPVYKKLGFIEADTKVERDGIAFVPMRLVLHSSN